MTIYHYANVKYVNYDTMCNVYCLIRCINGYYIFQKVLCVVYSV